MSFVGLLTGNIGSLLRARPIKPGRGQGSLDGATPARRRFGKGVASSRVDRRDDVEDVAIAEPGNLRFPAKNLTCSDVGTKRPRQGPETDFSDGFSPALTAAGDKVETAALAVLIEIARGRAEALIKADRELRAGRNELDLLARLLTDRQRTRDPRLRLPMPAMVSRARAPPDGRDIKTPAPQGRRRGLGETYDRESRPHLSREGDSARQARSRLKYCGRTKLLINSGPWPTLRLCQWSCASSTPRLGHQIRETPSGPLRCPIREMPSIATTPRCRTRPGGAAPPAARHRLCHRAGDTAVGADHLGHRLDRRHAVTSPQPQGRLPTTDGAAQNHTVASAILGIPIRAKGHVIPNR
jgi:hypothetical protein